MTNVRIVEVISLPVIRAAFRFITHVVANNPKEEKQFFLHDPIKFGKIVIRALILKNIAMFYYIGKGKSDL